MPERLSQRDDWIELRGEESAALDGSELLAPDLAKLWDSYFWSPATIAPVRVLVERDLVYTEEGFMYVNSLPLNKGNIVTGSALRDFEAGAHRGVLNRPVQCKDSGLVFLHSNYRTFGHFLLEMLPKLWALERLCGRLDGPVLVPASAPAFVSRWIETVIPDRPIEKVDMRGCNLLIKRAFVPEMLATHYAFGSAFKEFLASCPGDGDFSATPRKLLISRRARREQGDDFRYLSNFDELESMFVDRGFEVVQPELLSPIDQIRTFRTARIVAGELCSAIHNTIFTPRGATVMQFNPFNSVQRRIAFSAGQRLISVMPDDGIVRQWPASAVVDSNFRIDIELVAKMLSKECAL